MSNPEITPDAPNTPEEPAEGVEQIIGRLLARAEELSGISENKERKPSPLPPPPDPKTQTLIDRFRKTKEAKSNPPPEITGKDSVTPADSRSLRRKFD